MSEILAHLKELEEQLGADKVFVDTASRIAHRMSHSPEILLHRNRTSDFLPDAVVCGESTEDVVRLVKFANKYRIPLIPQGGRIGTMGSQGRKGAIALSLHRMVRILEFDEENEWVVVEPGIRVDHLGEFLQRRGYCRLEWPATRSACLGGRIGTDGYNRWGGRWGRTKDSVLALEMVLPEGDVSVLGEGSSSPVKSAMGYDLKDLFIGSRGTLGIATKIWLRTPKLPPVESWGYRAFPSMEDLIKAQIEISTDPITSAWVWRMTGAARWIFDRTFRIFSGVTPPEELGALLDYNVFGTQQIVDEVKKRIDGLAKKYGGFLSNKLPPEETFGRAAYTNRDLAINRFATLAGPRAEDGGRGGLWTPIDPAIPNKNATQYVSQTRKMLEEWDSRYPHFRNHAWFFPGMSVNASINYVFFYGVFDFDMPYWDSDFTNEFVKFYQDHADLVQDLQGTFTYVHGFAPRSVEQEMIKQEVGEVGYSLMKKIKRAIDPNNIMNPYIRFPYDDDPII
jgi:glycolate oxidase